MEWQNINIKINIYILAVCFSVVGSVTMDGYLFNIPQQQTAVDSIYGIISRRNKFVIILEAMTEIIT